MRPLRRGMALLVVVLTVLLTGVGPATARSTEAEATAADSVVVVGVAGLTWADIDPERTPELWGLAGESTIGSLSVRGARPTTCILDGWASLGAGNRARVPGPDDGLPPVPLPSVPLPEDPAGAPAASSDGTAPEPQLDTTLSYCGLQERAASVALVDPVATVRLTGEEKGTRRFDA